MKLEITERELAILGATLRRCIGWDDPKELERFVNVAYEHVRDGWTGAEMDQLLEKLNAQYFGFAAAPASETR